MNSEVQVFTDLDALSLAVAGDIAEEVEAAVSERGRFSMALSGGRTPRLLYQLLASQFCEKIPWDAVHLFWGDERYVPEDHPDSNFAMALDSLISSVPLPPQNVHRIPTEIEPPERAAGEYELLLREFFIASDGDESDGTFDVVLLGMGEDGHTASLFPGSEALDEKERWVMPVLSPPDLSPRRRITLTLPVLNSARKAFFIVSGMGKRQVLRSILDDPVKSEQLFPAARIHPRENLLWYVDREAFGRTRWPDQCVLR